ncbi:MAG: radical SAM protein [Bacteroidetes bacterium]|nr:radical SAM protein [Bacteroidota bacterium]
MQQTIGIIAPMTDLEQYHLDLTIHLPRGHELTLANLNELGQHDFNTEILPPLPQAHASIPAAGYYLSGLLRKEGYNTVLSGKFDKASLEKIADEDPVAICLSTTMILKSGSLRQVIRNIREVMPQTFIIVGGVYVWKSYRFYQIFPEIAKSDFAETLLFQKGTEDIEADVFIAAPHGRESLLMVLDELKKGRAADYSQIPNLAFPGKNGYTFTERKHENADFESDITHWDYIEDMPGQIPFRTSIGCPFRCRFCDFYHIYPDIYLRSGESLLRELNMIRKKLGDRPAILHATDDNVFMNPKRLREVVETIIKSGIPRWIGFLRASSVNESNIELIRQSGLMMAIIGVESGDTGQLERMNKKQKPQEVQKGIELLDQNGITAMMTFIAGYPGENMETIQNTANFMNNMEIGYASSSYQIFPLYISPFSDLVKKEFQDKWALSGVYDHWKHYTMNSDQARTAGYELFKRTIHVPYHYSQERTWYNKERFNLEVRRKLFGLRRQLTIAIVEHKPLVVSQAILNEMTVLMNGKDMEIPLDFISGLSVGFDHPAL